MITLAWLLNIAYELNAYVVMNHELYVMELPTAQIGFEFVWCVLLKCWLEPMRFLI